MNVKKLAYCLSRSQAKAASYLAYRENNALNAWANTELSGLPRLGILRNNEYCFRDGIKAARPGPRAQTRQ